MRVASISCQPLADYRPNCLRVASIVVGLFCALLSAATVAKADVLTFAGPTATILPGSPTVEGSFRYDAFSGGLFRSDARGNPAPDIEGLGTSGGVLRIVRNDVAGGLFRFDDAQIAQFSFGSSQPVTFSGFLRGVSQGTDVFNTAATNSVFPPCWRPT